MYNGNNNDNIELRRAITRLMNARDEQARAQHLNFIINFINQQDTEEQIFNSIQYICERCVGENNVNQELLNIFYPYFNFFEEKRMHFMNNFRRARCLELIETCVSCKEIYDISTKIMNRENRQPIQKELLRLLKDTDILSKYYNNILSPELLFNFILRDIRANPDNSAEYLRILSNEVCVETTDIFFRNYDAIIRIIQSITNPEYKEKLTLLFLDSIFTGAREIAIIQHPDGTQYLDATHSDVIQNLDKISNTIETIENVNAKEIAMAKFEGFILRNLGKSLRVKGLRRQFAREIIAKIDLFSNEFKIAFIQELHEADLASTVILNDLIGTIGGENRKLFRENLALKILDNSLQNGVNDLEEFIGCFNLICRLSNDLHQCSKSFELLQSGTIHLNKVQKNQEPAPEQNYDVFDEEPLDEDEIALYPIDIDLDEELDRRAEIVLHPVDVDLDEEPDRRIGVFNFEINVRNIFTQTFPKGILDCIDNFLGEVINQNLLHRLYKTICVDRDNNLAKVVLETKIDCVKTRNFLIKQFNFNRDLKIRKILQKAILNITEIEQGLKDEVINCLSYYKEFSHAFNKNEIEALKDPNTALMDIINFACANFHINGQDNLLFENIRNIIRGNENNEGMFYIFNNEKPGLNGVVFNADRQPEIGANFFIEENQFQDIQNVNRLIRQDPIEEDFLREGTYLPDNTDFDAVINQENIIRGQFIENISRLNTNGRIFGAVFENFRGNVRDDERIDYIKVFNAVSLNGHFGTYLDNFKFVNQNNNQQQANGVNVNAAAMLAQRQRDLNRAQERRHVLNNQNHQDRLKQQRQNEHHQKQVR